MMVCVLIVVKTCRINYLCIRFVGVMIQVPSGIQIIEGDVGQICVQITNGTLIVERDVEVTLTIPPGKCPLFMLPTTSRSHCKFLSQN